MSPTLYAPGPPLNKPVRQWFNWRDPRGIGGMGVFLRPHDIQSPNREYEGNHDQQ